MPRLRCATFEAVVWCAMCDEGFGAQHLIGRTAFGEGEGECECLRHH